MIVLGFDTATPATAVGLRLADGTTLQSRDDPPADRSRETLASDRFGRHSLRSHPRIDQHSRFGQRPGHATRLLPMASELLAQAGLRWGELGRIAVGVGPGTFTGLRIGVATARGLAQSLGVEVVGVGTLSVLAEAALRGAQQGAPGSEPSPPASVLAVIDARRGEVFAAAHAPEGALVAPRALAPQELGGLAAQAGGRRRWLAVGDGAVRYRDHLEAFAAEVPADSSPLHRVDAGVLCELSLSAPAGALEEVLPDYRRRPDAEIALQARRSGVR
jgi:tRNA threonylcarbamoyladenosine biosynthesis protein TsaB